MDPHLPSLGGPAAAGARAQLLLALLLAAILPMLLLYHPIQTHAVRLDLPRVPDSPVSGAAPRFFRASDVFLPVEPEDPDRYRRLEGAPANEVLLDGEAVDLVELGIRLERLSVSSTDWVDFRPDPNARYEAFLEVLAVVRRAAFDRLRLDSRPFRDALDDGDSAYEWI